MAGIRLFTSNRLEILAEKLSELLHAPLASPLTPEVIIVQSRGMERWLSLAIAHRQGMCANVRFPFPKAFVEEAFFSVLGGEPVTEIFSPEIMTWKLMKLLPSFENHGAFGQINCYLKGQGPPDASLLSEEGPPCIPSPFYSSRETGNGLKRLQLAQRIARVFDQYLIFRPDMVTAWERGECSRRDERWQCELWRALVAGGAHADTLPRIPYTIADRKSHVVSSTIDGFMMLFDMAGGRFGAGQVLAPLEIPEVAAKFGIEQTDREIIRRWVRETGIRWGIDGDGRRRLGLPAVHENTWRAGLDRLPMER